LGIKISMYKVGDTYVRLTILEFMGVDHAHKKLIKCLCTCGNEKIIRLNNFGRKTSSCGCLKAEKIHERCALPIEERKNRFKRRDKQYKANAKAANPELFREKANNRVKRYIKKNKEIIKQRKKDRKANDPVFLLKMNLRNRIKIAFKKNYKSGMAIKYLGCSIEQLKIYLESLFVNGMTWENYGLYGWHIDHIIPVSSIKNVEDIEQISIVCNFKNLQPLWAKDNLKKGAK